MAKTDEKIKALKLRKQGKSIKDISDILGVSKGSVSLWCRDVILTKTQKQKLKQKQIASGSVGRQLGANKNRMKRLDAISKHQESARKIISQISDRDLLLLGIGLYWGEGVKSRSGMTALVNSDPEVIKIGKRWFEKCLGVLPSDFRPYIYISEAYASRQNEIVKFWTNEISLKRNQFKVIILKNRPKKVYSNHNSYHGVISLRIAKSTDLKYKIQGLIDACKNTRN